MEERKKKRRRSQADRTADTRVRLIEATILCLDRVGYAATSISGVASAAGLSRAIIGYHFSSKADLMVAVRDHIFQHLMKSIIHSIDAIGARATIEQMPKVVYEGTRGAPAVAQLEIALASRGDPALQMRLREKERSFFEEVVAMQPRLFDSAEISLPKNFSTILSLTQATLSGIALTEAVLGEEARSEACVEMFNRLMNSELRLIRNDRK